MLRSFGAVLRHNTPRRRVPWRMCEGTRSLWTNTTDVGNRLVREVFPAWIAESRSFVQDHELNLFKCKRLSETEGFLPTGSQKGPDEKTGRQACTTPSQSSTLFNPGFEMWSSVTRITCRRRTWSPHRRSSGRHQVLCCAPPDVLSLVY